MSVLKHIRCVPRGKLTDENVVIPVSPGATVICVVPFIGVPPAIVTVGVNVPLLPPEFAQTTTMSTIAGQSVVHAIIHPLAHGISPMVMLCIVISAGICTLDPNGADP
jgi:hypothetical protein